MDFLPSLLMFIVVAAFTPGPNNIMIMASGLNFGLRRSVPHLFGICLGFPLMVTALGFGAGVLFERFSNLHEIIKVFGICYLSYLAWGIAMASPEKNIEGRSRPLSFFQAMLFQWVNPKAWIMATSAIATYTSVGEDITTQLFTIVLVFFLMAWPSAGTWLLFGTVIHRILKNPIHHRVFNLVMAVLLLASMYGVVVELIYRYS